MDRQSALATLQLDDDASDALIRQVIKDQRAMIEGQLSATTGVARRVQWQKELSYLDDIEDVLLGHSSTGEHQTEIVDRRGRALEDEEGRGDGEMVSGRRPPPIPSSESGFDPEAATQILSPSDSRSATQDGWRTATGVKVTRKPSLPPPLATNEDKTKLIDDAKAPNSSRSLRLIMAIFMLLLLMVAAGGYAAWVGLYLPSQVAKHRAAGVQLLVALISDVTGMPEDGERSHAKVRSLCWLATALASTGHRSEATPLITAANELIAKWEGEQTHREDLCRLFAAHAAWGDPQAAVKELGTLQAEREQAARSVKGGSNAPSARTPLHEDNARRAIAIALARQSKGSEAISIVGAISSLHDDCAAEALCEVARQFNAAGNVSGATDVFRQIEQRAGKVSDPLTRAALVVSVAPLMQALLGDAKVMPLVRASLDGFANSSAEQTGYSDMEARVLISRLTLLPLALRFGGESRESYRTQLESLSSQAVNLALPSGENKGKPDFKNRARACAAVASGWAVLGQGWFSGDAKVRSQEMITNALGYAEQVAPPVQVAGADDAIVTQHQRELALVALVGALAQSGQYERSFEIWHRIGLPENQGVAGELLAFRLGGAQRMEDASRLLRDTPDGEARTRAAVAFLYGLYQLPLEKWW